MKRPAKASPEALLRRRAFYLRLPRETLRAAMSRQAASPASPTAQETETVPGPSPSSSKDRWIGEGARSRDGPSPENPTNSAPTAFGRCSRREAAFRRKPSARVPRWHAKFVGCLGRQAGQLLCRARSGNPFRLPAASAKIEDVGEYGLSRRPAAGAATADGERLTAAEGQ